MHEEAFLCNIEKEGRYSLHDSNGLVTTYRKTISLPLIDGIFLKRFFERLRNWTGFEDWSEQIAQKEKALKAKKGNIEKAIAEAQSEWEETMNTLTDPKLKKQSK